MHTDGVESNSSVLVADGKAALDRGDFTAAEKYFGLAKLHNPKNSEALVGYAEAYLKSNGFSLGTFITNMLGQMNNEQSTGEEFNFIKPEDWGQTSVSDLTTVFQTVINTLEPIALGQTEGPISSLDINVNATSGIFYVLTFALDIETLTTQYEIITLTKTEVQTSLPEIPPTSPVWDELPEEFLWFKDLTTSNLPTLSEVNQFSANLNIGLTRLRTAAAQSSSPDILNSVIEMFEDWETLANQ